MMTNLKDLLTQTKDRDLNYVVYSKEKGICEPAVGVDELKICLQGFTVADLEDEVVSIFAFAGTRLMEDLMEYHQGYEEAKEAIEDLEDYFESLTDYMEDEITVELPRGVNLEGIHDWYSENLKMLEERFEEATYELDRLVHMLKTAL